MEKIFKAIRLDTGEWVEFDLFDGLSAITWEIFDKNTLCQYTGINDSEGSKIFEGDELRVYGGSKVIAKMTVDGVMFGGWEYKHVIEDIDRLTGHNIHDKD